MCDSIGDLRMIAGDTAPRGTVLCDGALLNIADEPDLYGVIGTKYGGDGETTFGLPDLRGRFPMGASAEHLSGATGGAASVSLTGNQMPEHNHDIIGDDEEDGASSQQIEGGKLLANAETIYKAKGSGAPKEKSFHVSMCGNAGSGQPFDNRPPFVAVNFVIVTRGEIPK